MKRKTAAILVGMMVSVSLTAGCGSNEATEAASQGEQTGAEDEEETEEASKEEEEETAATGEAEEGEEDNQEESSETQEPEEEEKGTVAVLLPDDTDERWAADGGYIRTELENAGYEPQILYAQGDGQKQAEQAAEMIEEEVDAFLIAPADAYSLTDALAGAKEKGIPVFSYDDLIMDSDAVSYYITFNSREIGHALGNSIIEKMDLEKAREDGKSYNIEFFMGSPDDLKSLFLYNGVMEVLNPYLEDETLVCQSGRTSFHDTAIMRFSESEAQRILKETLEESYQGKTLDIACTAFDGAALGVAQGMEEAGISPDQEQWPMITGVGCELSGMQGIAAGSQTNSVYMDRENLAKQGVNMVDTYLKGEDPEVTDYEQYDNGKKIIGTYTCEIQLIDKDNFELLIDKGLYTEEEVLPEGFLDEEEEAPEVSPVLTEEPEEEETDTEETDAGETDTEEETDAGETDTEETEPDPED